MATHGTYQDVYFITVEDDGFEHLFCLYAYFSRRPSASGHFLTYVMVPESDDILFFDCAPDLKTLRAQLDEAIGRAGELVFCYRDEPIMAFEWYTNQ